MKLVNLEDRIYLNDIDGLAGDEFLQANFWREFLKNSGEKTEIFGVQEQGKIIAASLVIKKTLIGPWFYYYAPRGPRGEEGAIKFLIEEFKKESPPRFF